MTAIEESINEYFNDLTDQKQRSVLRYLSPPRQFEHQTGILGLSAEYKLPEDETYESLNSLWKLNMLVQFSSDIKSYYYELGKTILALNPVLARRIDKEQPMSLSVLNDVIAGVASRFCVDDIEYYLETVEQAREGLRHDEPRQELRKRLLSQKLAPTFWITSPQTMERIKSQLDERCCVNPFMDAAVMTPQVPVQAQLPIAPLLLSHLCRLTRA